MKRIAMIKESVVVNIALWDGETEWNPEGFILVDVTEHPEVKIGTPYIDAQFIAESE